MYHGRLIKGFALLWCMQAGGKWYDVETGRRDGRVSIDTEANANLPPPNISIPASIILFAQKGLTISDMVVLLGL